MKSRATRTKVSISLPSSLILRIDREARKSKDSRSGVIEVWLRREERRAEQEAYDAEVRAYYANQSAEERAEDEAIARACAASWIEQLRREEGEQEARAPSGGTAGASKHRARLHVAKAKLVTPARVLPRAKVSRTTTPPRMASSGRRA